MRDASLSLAVKYLAKNAQPVYDWLLDRIRDMRAQLAGSPAHLLV